MRDTANLDPGLRTVLTLAALVVIVAGLKAASAVFIPLLLALFLSVLSLPLLDALVARRVPRLLAVGLTLLADAAVVGLLGWMLGAAVADFTGEAPRYQERFEALVDSAIAVLEGRGFPASDWISPAAVSPRALVDLVRNTFVGVASVVTAVVLVLLLMTFMLLEAAGIRGKLRRALGADPERLRRLQAVAGDLQRYLAIKTLISLATGISAGLLVWAVGMDSPLFWGLVTFGLNYIPSLGSILAAIPAVFFAAIQLGPTRALVVVAGYAVINLWWGNLVEPNLMGRRMRLSPLVVFVSLIFWGWLWGPMGMLLSVPLTMMVKLLLENSADLRWLARLLDPSDAAPAGGPAPGG
jgi:predicted PurR-regulated permease PerM